MQDLPFRTNTTWLRTEDLILLDVLFDRTCVAFCCLRRDTFRELWNLGYSHNLNDDELTGNLRGLCEQGVLESAVQDDQTSFKMTTVGGQLWSEERCPVWERFCAQQGVTRLGGQRLTRLVAVTPHVLEDFLKLSPLDPPPHPKSSFTKMADDGLIPWRPFPHLYCGTAIDTEPPNKWTLEEYAVYNEHVREHQELLKRKRSWWESVPQLQRFTPSAA